MPVYLNFQGILSWSRLVNTKMCLGHPRLRRATTQEIFKGTPTPLWAEALAQNNAKEENLLPWFVGYGALVFPFKVVLSGVKLVTSKGVSNLYPLDVKESLMRSCLAADWDFHVFLLHR